MAGKHFNALALACICATFVAMDGPLLQRASTVRQRVPTDPQLLDVKILPEVSKLKERSLHCPRH